MATTLYGSERLARLLRLLRPAPEGWVTRAKQIFSDDRVSSRPTQPLELLTDADVRTLRQALDNDPVFRERFDSDPIAAVESAGMPELAAGLEREMGELVALAERVATDSAFRTELDADPVGALTGAGVPAAAAEPLLHALALPDVLAKLPEVVAHGHQQPAHEEQLLVLLLGSAAVVQRIRSARPRH